MTRPRTPSPAQRAAIDRIKREWPWLDFGHACVNFETGQIVDMEARSR